MDGYKILSALGHSRTPLYPALTQVRTDAAYPRALKGVRANCRVTLRKGNRVLEEKSGELLFTDTGVSGTVIFELSRAAACGGEGLELSMNFLPDMGNKRCLSIYGQGAVARRHFRQIRYLLAPCTTVWVKCCANTQG